MTLCSAAEKVPPSVGVRGAARLDEPGKDSDLKPAVFLELLLLLCGYEDIATLPPGMATEGQEAPGAIIPGHPPWPHEPSSSGEGSDASEGTGSDVPEGEKPPAPASAAPRRRLMTLAQRDALELGGPPAGEASSGSVAVSPTEETADVDSGGGGGGDGAEVGSGRGGKGASAGEDGDEGDEDVESGGSDDGDGDEVGSGGESSPRH